MPELVPGTFRSVPGFHAAGVHAGLKRSRRDIAVLLADHPCIGAAVYTRNLVQAAPLHVTREHLARSTPRAVAVNSGNANACTGPQGTEDARRMAAVTADALDLPPAQVLVASTGLIGHPLPMAKVEPGLRRAAARIRAGDEGGEAEAILTTDTREKEVLATFEAGGRVLHLGGLAKGSGMVHPNMGTMLAFLATDAAIPRPALQEALRTVTDATFNMVTVDGDTSTNDLALLLAGGTSGVDLAPGVPGWDAFLDALHLVCRKLARDIAADGEGATTLLAVEVDGAATLQEARAAARAVAGSSLVKAAIFGRDPNWGRILAALGATHATFDPGAVAVQVQDGGAPLPVVHQGRAAPDADPDALRHALAGPEVTVAVDLSTGPHRATAWGCDLTPDYVRINAAYPT